LGRNKNMYFEDKYLANVNKNIAILKIRIPPA
jgi:hypothetical protein